MPPWLPSSLDHGRIGAEQKGPPPQLQPDHMLMLCYVMLTS